MVMKIKWEALYVSELFRSRLRRLLTEKKKNITDAFEGKLTPSHLERENKYSLHDFKEVVWSPGWDIIKNYTPLPLQLSEHSPQAASEPRGRPSDL